MRKGVISIFTLLFLGTTIVLAVLLLNAKRETLSKGLQALPSLVKEETKTAKLPSPRTYANPIVLPAPKLRGSMSVEEAIAIRRSWRTFDTKKPLTLAQLSQLLWSAQGVTDKAGHRAAPSAREAYPYTVYAMVRNVTGLKPGFYEYLPDKNALGDMNLSNAPAGFDNAGVEATAKGTPVVIILTAAFGKKSDVFKGNTQPSYYLEGGHIGENLYLQVESMKLGMVVQGGVGTVQNALKIDPAETVVYVIPIGYRAPMPSPTPSAK